MADNTQLNTGTGGDTVRGVDKAGAKTQVTLLDVGGLGAESLFTGAVTVAGVATAAKQDTGNTSLASIDTKLTNPLPVSGTLGISGTVAATQSGTWTVQQGGSPWGVTVSGSVAVTGTFFQATQPVSIAATVAVSGPLTDAQLRATPVPVSGTVTANAGTNLNTSALALEAGNLATLTAKDFATQTTLALVKAKTDNLDVALSTRVAEATFTTRIPVQGQAAMAASVPVVIASNQAAVPVSAASLPLPTGAATEATQLLQATEVTLAAIKAILNLTQGQVGTSSTGPLMQTLVSDTPSVYLPDELRPLSVNTEGRLRVTTVVAETFMEFFDNGNPFFAIPHMTYPQSPWDLGDASPFP